MLKLKTRPGSIMIEALLAATILMIVYVSFTRWQVEKGTEQANYLTIDLLVMSAKALAVKVANDQTLSARIISAGGLLEIPSSEMTSTGLFPTGFAYTAPSGEALRFWAENAAAPIGWVTVGTSTYRAHSLLPSLVANGGGEITAVGYERFNEVTAAPAGLPTGFGINTQYFELDPTGTNFISRFRPDDLDTAIDMNGFALTAVDDLASDRITVTGAGVVSSATATSLNVGSCTGC